MQKHFSCQVIQCRSDARRAGRDHRASTGSFRAGASGLRRRCSCCTVQHGKSSVKKRSAFIKIIQGGVLPFLKMLQLALLNRVPFGKFNRASAFPVACCVVSERTTIKWIHSLHFEDSLQLAAGSFNNSGERERSFYLQSERPFIFHKRVTAFLFRITIPPLPKEPV
jgi:hypothetical protein